MVEKHPTTPILDFRGLARKRLPRHLFDFIDGGSFNEVTITRNTQDLQRILLQKRALRDVSRIDLTTEALGQQLAQPVILGPVGFSGIYARRGEVQAARAAEQAGVPFCLSTVGICSIEEVRKAIGAPFWFQLYMIKDRGYCLEMLQRAHAAGCPVLLFTVDLPVVGVRYRGARYGMNKGTSPFSAKMARAWQFLSHPRWFIDVVLRGQPLVLGNLASVVPTDIRNLTKIRHWVDSQLDAGMTWKDFEWVRANWPGKLALKGIMSPDDALTAASLGADGIVVSNHAGRHLDSTPSTISVLPSIAEAAGNRLDILFDGGVFSGLDVIKAIAMGAKSCMIGRSWAYALAANGQQGVSEVLSLLRNEMEIAMAHLGVDSIGKIDRSVIYGDMI